MCCFPHTSSVCSIIASVYSVKRYRTRQWIKDQEAKVSGGTTQAFWKQLSDLHLKTQWSSVLTLTQAHGAHRWMWMCVPSRVTLKATEQTTGVSICCVSLVWINRQTKKIFFWALVYHRFFEREKKRKPVLGRKLLYGAALKPFQALNIKLCHWDVCYLFDSIQLLCSQP